ncbi:MAG: hypothetical protein IK044_02150, partial [Methanobrevibacter sp.]|nr:hypothetical protein [Methanobrevibacter sp.]
MTLNDDYSLKNTKNNVSTSKNESSINFNSDDFDEKLYGEVKYISNALKEGSLNLPSDEESKLKQDLKLILSNIEKQHNNSKKMTKEKSININESKDLDFDDFSFVEDMGTDSSFNSSFEDSSALGDKNVISISEVSSNSQNLVNDDVMESVESEGIVVDDVMESVESEGIVVDDVMESVESEG